MNKSRLLKVSKIDVARRQIESAIWLWFVDSDTVSVHTLAAAAHRVLRDFAKNRGLAPLAVATAYLPERLEKETKHTLRDAETFFKHAKNAETCEFNEAWTEFYLFDVVMGYIQLLDDDARSALMSTFIVRFGVQRPDLFAIDAFPFLEREVDKVFNIERLQKLSKLEFLEEFFGLLRRPAADPDDVER
jgi:hypothetical protein